MDPNSAKGRQTADVYERAQSMTMAGRSRDARMLLAPILGTNPDDVRALRIVASSYIRESSLEAGIRGLPVAEHILGLEPDEVRSWLQMSALSTLAARHKEARKAARTAQAMTPGRAGVHAQVGYADLAANRITRHTVKSIKEGLRLDPNIVFTQFQVARIAARKRRYKESQSTYERILLLDPNALHADTNLLLVRMALGHPGESARRAMGKLAERPADPWLKKIVPLLVHNSLRRFHNLLWAASGLLLVLTAFRGDLSYLPSDYSPQVIRITMTVTLIAILGAIAWWVARFIRETGDQIAIFLRAALRASPRAWVFITIEALAAVAMVVATWMADDRSALWIAVVVVSALTLLRYGNDAYLGGRERLQLRRDRKKFAL